MRRDLAQPLPRASWPSGIDRVPFTPAIAPACRGLMNVVYAEGYGDARPFDEWWSWLNASEDYDPALIYVAIEGGNVAGFCHSWIDPFIKDIVVASNWRRRGLGSALLTAALETYAGRNEPFVDLKTDVDNFAAQSMYKRLGFVIVERVDLLSS